MSLFVLVALGIIIIVAITLVILGLRNKTRGEGDPLMARLAELSQREEPVSLEEIELSQPFADRVIRPILRKLGESTKGGGPLLKRIAQAQSDKDKSPHTGGLQTRRVSAPVIGTQSGSYFDLKARVKDRLLSEIDPSMDVSKTDEVRHTLQALFEQVLLEENIVLSRPERARLFSQIAAEILEGKTLEISVSCPKLLSKKFETTFLIQLYLALESTRVDANIKAEFHDREVTRHTSKSELGKGEKIRIKLFHPDFLFSDAVTKTLDRSLNKIVIMGKPKDECEPGEHKILVTISDAGTDEELDSFTFTANVVDFVFGKISRPMFSRVSAFILGLGSFTMFALTLMEQIDKTVGLASGTAAGVITLAISANFYTLFQRVRPITP